MIKVLTRLRPPPQKRLTPRMTDKLWVSDQFTSAKEVMSSPVSVCWLVVWFVSRLRHKLEDGFPWNLSGGWVSAPNIHHLLLTWFWVNGRFQSFSQTQSNIKLDRPVSLSILNHPKLLNHNHSSPDLGSDIKLNLVRLFFLIKSRSLHYSMRN